MSFLFSKWLHIVAVISWMAGILYLFRLFVYLSERGDNKDIHELLTLMANRLFKYITRPAMVIAVIAGLHMLYLNPELLQGWMHAKIVLVALMIIITIRSGRLVVRYSEDYANAPTSKAMRIMNEVPTVLMMIIVALVVFRPF